MDFYNLISKGYDELYGEEQKVKHDIIKANLNIRNLPDEIYKKIKEKANKNRRSINNEVVYILNDVLQPEETKEIISSETTLSEILKIRNNLKGRRFPNSAKLIRGMRDEE